MPGDWARVQNAADPHVEGVTAMSAALLAQVALLHRLEREEEQLVRTTQAGGRAMDTVARSARTVYTHVADTTRMLLRWTGITGLFSGLLGFGGLLGLDRMAHNASDLRSQGLQNYANPNSILGARVNWGPFFDPGAAMSSIAKHQNITDPSLPIIGLGGMMNAPTDQVMNAMLQKARDFMMHTPREQWQAMPQWKIFADVFGEGGMRAIGGMSQKEFQEHMSRSRSDAAAIGVSDPTLQAAQHFAQQLERTATVLEYKLMAALDKAWPALDKLASAVGDVVVGLIGSSSFKEAIDFASKGIEWLGDYLKSDDFKKDLRDFAAFLGKMVTGLREAVGALTNFINWLNGKSANPEGGTDWDNPDLYGNWKYRLEHPSGSGVAPENTPLGRIFNRLKPNLPGTKEYNPSLSPDISRQPFSLWNPGSWLPGHHMPAWTPPAPIEGKQSGADPRGQEAAIRASAARWGVDPDDAVALSRAEGLSAPYKSWDVNGYSYGGFQMHEGGLLDEFKKANPKIDPTDPANEQKLNDWAIWYGSQHGWSKWSAVTGGKVRAPRATPMPGQQSSSTGSKSSAAAVDDMMQLAGLSGSDPRVRQFIRDNGGTIDPATTAWCAAFMNAALAHEGIQGTGKNTAESFANWGVPVTGNVQKGDVALEPPGEGYTGHVGGLTGRTRIGPNGQLQYEFVSSHQKGDMSNPSGVDWRDASHFRTIRRALEMDKQNAPGSAQEQAPSTSGIGKQSSYAQPVSVGVGVKLTNMTGGSAIVSASQLA